MGNDREECRATVTTVVYSCEECGYEIVETDVGQQPRSKVLRCEECRERREFRQNGS